MIPIPVRVVYQHTCIVSSTLHVHIAIQYFTSFSAISQFRLCTVSNSWSNCNMQQLHPTRQVPRLIRHQPKIVIPTIRELRLPLAPTHAYRNAERHVPGMSFIKQAFPSIHCSTSRRSASQVRFVFSSADQDGGLEGPRSDSHHFLCVFKDAGVYSGRLHVCFSRSTDIYTEF